jgi:hypothetical protein
MSYVEKHLIAGETVVYTTRLHWTVLLWPMVLALIFGASGIALLVRYASDSGDKSEASTAMMAGGVLLLIVALVCVIVGIAKRNSTEMAVTNKRLVIKVGIATRETIDLLLQQVESIKVDESFMGRILGYGTVIVRGTGGTPDDFDRISNPIEFRKQVQQQIEKLPGQSLT